MLSQDELEALSRYAMGEAEPEQARQIEKMLDERPELRQGLERLRNLDEACKELPETLDDQGVERILGRVVRPRRDRRWWWTVPGGVAAAAAVALFVLPSERVELVSFAGDVEVDGRALGVAAHQPLRKGETLRTGGAGRAIVQAPHEALVVEPETQVRVRGPGELELLSGEVEAAAEAGKLFAASTRIDIAGRAVAAMEPTGAVSRVTGAFTPNVSGDTTMKSTQARALAAAGGLTVMVLVGHASASQDGRTVAIAEGERWRSGDAAATRALPVGTMLAAAPAALPKASELEALRAENTRLTQENLALKQQLLEKEATDDESLARRVKELEAQLGEERNLREMSEGKIPKRPQNLPERFTGEALRSALQAFFKEGGLKAQVTSVDCSEYPCILFGEGWGNREDSEAAAPYFKNSPYGKDSRFVWGWNTKQGQYFSVVILPEGSEERELIRKRLDFRISQMRDAANR